MQPNYKRKLEIESLKKNIKCYYFKHISILGNNFIQFVDFNPFFIKKVIKILKTHQINLIHVDYVYGINILRFLTKIPIAYNAYNVEAIYYNEIGKYNSKIPFFLRYFYAKYIYFLEKRAIKVANLINAFSNDDKKIFIKMYNIPEEKIFANTMGYKKEIFKNNVKKEIAREKLNIDKNKFVVIFHGFYFKNDANREAIDIIRNKIAPQIIDNNILFLIAGEMPHFKDKYNLKFLGFVDELQTFLYAANIAIVPVFRGSGVRVKMIDYLSAKIPMISTKQAILGLSFINNKHGILVSEDEPIKDMIEKIYFLKNNPDKIEEFKKNISNLLEKEYNWDIILDTLKRNYLKILKK